MSKIARTTLSAAAGGAMLVSSTMIPSPVGAGPAGVFANTTSPSAITFVKGGGGGGGGGLSAGSNYGFLDVPQPDYSRPNLDYNLPAPGPNSTFKSRAAYCKKTFKTYDARTGTYIGKDGKRHRCY